MNFFTICNINIFHKKNLYLVELHRLLIYYRIMGSKETGGELYKKKAAPPRIFSCLILLLVPALFIAPSFHALGQKGGYKYYKTYGPEEYNRFPINWEVRRDRRGVVYVANHSGLLEFDGISWRVFECPHFTVRSLAVDDSGIVYAGGNNEIGYFAPGKGGKLVYHSLLQHLKDGLRNFAYVKKTHRTARGIWYRTQKYLFLWDPHSKRVKAWEASGSFQNSFVCGGELYVHLPRSGLMKIEKDSLQVAPGGEALAGKELFFMAPFTPGTGKLLIGTRSHGFFLYGGGVLEPFRTGADEYIKEKNLYNGIALSSRPGHFALATQLGGAVVMDDRGEIAALFDNNWGLPSNNVKSIFEDNRGNLWLAMEKGITMIEYASPISMYDERSGLAGLVLSAAEQPGKDGTVLYVGTTTGVFFLTPHHLFQPVQGISGAFHALLPGPGQLLAAGDRGIFQVLPDHRVRRISTWSALALARSRADPNRTWVGGGGLMSLYRQPGGNTWTPEQQFLENDVPIRSIVEAPDGALWLGTLTNGVIRVNFTSPRLGKDHVITRYIIDGQLPPGECFVHWAAGHVMVGTERGLYHPAARGNRLIPDNTLGKQFCDGSRNVFRLAQDNKSAIWLHSRGVNFRALPNGGNHYAVSDKPLRRLSSHQVNGIFPGRAGDCTWFAGNNGLVRFDTGIKNNHHPPFRTVIRRVLVNGAERYGGYSPAPALVLPHDERNLRFRFASPYFQGREKIRYQCFLEGHDDSWSDWQSEPWKDYMKLAPGAYRFQVRARNIYRYLSEDETFSFTILPPWYLTPWAYGGYLLLAGLSFFGGIKWRYARLEADRRLLRRHVKNTTKELKFKNQLLEEQAVQVEIQAQELQEMAAVRTRFFANVSHELRTPLTLIMGPMEQLQIECLNPVHRKRLDMMHRNALRLLTLIDQMLALSRIDKGKMKLNAYLQNVVPFLKGTLASFRLAAHQNQIRFEFQPGEDEIFLYYDLEKLDDVFCNLFLNIVNLTPYGETITITLKKHTGGGSPVREGGEVPSSPPFPFLEILVRVSGLELPGEHLEHIFDRFYLAEEALEHQPKGYGIGLALARELVALHRGSISAWRCKENTRCTAFSIRLPMGKGHLGKEDLVECDTIPASVKTPRSVPLFLPKAESKPPPPGSGRSPTQEKQEALPEEIPEHKKNLILVVEDNADAREFIIDSLQPEYQVLGARHGQEGLRKARAQIPDLVILDIIMPYIDGYELCHMLKTEVGTSHIPIIMLTAKEGEENMLRGLETGADAYVTKPFNTRLLHARIKNLIDLRRQFQSRVKRKMVLEPEETPVSSLDEKFLEELQGHIEKNLSASEFNVDMLAKKLIMSRATLYRKVHALTGESPNRFIRSYRLKRAAQLLKAHFGNVGEVAMEVGFTNISYFSQCFKEKFHQLPSEYHHTQGVEPAPE